MLAVLIALVAVQQLFTLPGGSALMRAAQDSLHAPWFFTVVVVVSWWFRPRGLVQRLIWVGGIGVLIALVTEVAQMFVVGRSASVLDLQRDFIGGALGFVFSAALLRVGSGRPLLVFSFTRVCVALLALLALAVYTVWEPWQELELRRYRAELPPVVVDIADERTAKFVAVNYGSDFQFGTASSVWPAYEGRQVLRLTFGTNEYPTLYVNELMQLWAPYVELGVDVFVLGDDPLVLTIAVQYEGSWGTSAYHEVSLQPGANALSIPRERFLPDEATALKVRDLLFYTTDQFSGRSLMLGSVVLR